MKARTYTTGKPCKRGHAGPRSVVDRGCVECKRLRGMEDYAANKEKHSARKAAAYAANPEKWHAQSAAWRKANPKRASQISRNWQKRNEERERVHKAAYRKANPEKTAALSAAWAKANPERCAAHTARRTARKRAAPGAGVTADQWCEVLRESLGICSYCGASSPLTMDHIEPLSSGGAHDVSNIVAACGSCNSSKKNRTLLGWLAQRAGA